jgi:hypothetical protein
VLRGLRGHVRPHRRGRRSLAPLVLVALAVACGRASPGDCYRLLDVEVCGDTVRAAAPAPRPGGGPWACDAGRCEQRMARQPDDGNWECADLDGVVVCHGGTAAAGVAPGPPDPGWICGQRRGARAAAVDRVCVDLTPDFPDGQPRGWRCSARHEDGENRSCRRAAAAPALGAACAAPAACKPGDRCLDGRCVLERPQPDCWIDPDCDAPRRCRRGTCR